MHGLPSYYGTAVHRHYMFDPTTNLITWTPMSIAWQGSQREDVCEFNGSYYRSVGANGNYLYAYQSGVWTNIVLTNLSYCGPMVVYGGVLTAGSGAGGWVYQYTGTTWNALGSAPTGYSQIVRLVVMGGYLYAACNNGTVFMWQSPNWVKVGSTIAEAAISWMELIGGNLYITTPTGKVYQWNTTTSTWVSLGIPCSGLTNVLHIRDNGSGLVTMACWDNGQVWQYNGTAWVQLGTAGVTIMANGGYTEPLPVTFSGSHQFNVVDLCVLNGNLYAYVHDNGSYGVEYLVLWNPTGAVWKSYARWALPWIDVRQANNGFMVIDKPAVGGTIAIMPDYGVTLRVTEIFASKWNCAGTTPTVGHTPMVSAYTAMQGIGTAIPFVAGAAGTESAFCQGLSRDFLLTHEHIMILTNGTGIIAPIGCHGLQHVGGHQA